MKKKGIICLLLFLIMSCIPYGTAEAEGSGIRILVNQQEAKFEHSPILAENNKVIVSLEDFGEAINADIVWDGTGQRFAIGYGDIVCIVDVGSREPIRLEGTRWSRVLLEEQDTCFYSDEEGQFFVPLLAMSALLKIENHYDVTGQTVYLTCSGDEKKTVTAEDILCLDILQYVMENSADQFDCASEDFQEFYDQRVVGIDALVMGISDIWAGVQDILSGMTNAENVMKNALETLLVSLPENDAITVNHEILDLLKSGAVSANMTINELAGIKNELLEISPELKPLTESVKNLDDIIGDTGLIYDTAMYSVDILAVLLSDYEKNISYLTVLETSLRKNNALDESLEKSIAVLREEYTNKFLQIFLETRDEMAKFTISNLADLATGGAFSVGDFAWKACFQVSGVNDKGAALKLFYGLYCINGALDTAYKNQYIKVQQNDFSNDFNIKEIKELRQLDDLQRALKAKMYECIRIVTNDADTQEYCRIKEEEYSESCLSWEKIITVAAADAGMEDTSFDEFDNFSNGNATTKNENEALQTDQVYEEDSLNTEHLYVIYNTPLDWEEAKAYCESLGGHLAVITSEEEQQKINEIVSADGEMEAYWLGGRKNTETDSFEWVTGEPFDYTNWNEGEPNNYLNREEDCLQLLPDEGWNDMAQKGDPTGIQLSQIGFICEWDMESE